MKRMTTYPWGVAAVLYIAACGHDTGGQNYWELSGAFSRTDAVNSIMADTAPDSLAAGYYLTMVSHGVSSGEVRLNNEILFGPSDFKNNDRQETLSVDIDWENTISATIRGKPGDQLCVRVFEVPVDETDPETTLFEDCVDRSAGPPNSSSSAI